MTADISKLRNKGNGGVNRNRELVHAYKLIELKKDAYGDVKELVDCRLYMGRSANASRVYCTIWINAEPHYGGASGSAGGYGYHKQSAAVADAISGAGIVLSENIGGVGSNAIRGAITAIGVALGYPEETTAIIEAYA